MTASSFNSVSIDPALVLWSIDKGALTLEAFRNATHFAVNVLNENQVDLSNNFAVRGGDKFSGITYSDDPKGCPLLPDCAAQFECKTWNIYEGGDHYIIVGEVLDFRSIEEAAPLVFAGGNYAVTAKHPG